MILSYTEFIDLNFFDHLTEFQSTHSKSTLDWDYSNYKLYKDKMGSDSINLNVS